MNWTSLGTAARFQMMQQNGTQMRQDLQRLSSELASGQHRDLGRATGGDFTALAEISRSLRLTESFSRSMAETGFAATARQTALGRIEVEIDGLVPHLLGVSSAGTLKDMALALADAPERLAQAVSALNTRVTGVSLFSGDAPERPALISAAAMMEHLRPLVASAGSAADKIAVVEEWFLAPGGGFEALAWQGGPGPAAPAILGEGAQTQAAITALEPALRELLAGLALTTIAAETSDLAAAEDRRMLVSAGVARLQNGEDGLIRLRSDLGASQARIEEARVSAEAARAGLEIERSRLSDVDPYRSATELQELQTRLETLYVVTARLSRLTLTEFLR